MSIGWINNIYTSEHISGTWISYSDELLATIEAKRNELFWYVDKPKTIDTEYKPQTRINNIYWLWPTINYTDSALLEQHEQAREKMFTYTR